MARKQSAKRPSKSGPVGGRAKPKARPAPAQRPHSVADSSTSPSAPGTAPPAPKPKARAAYPVTAQEKEAAKPENQRRKGTKLPPVLMAVKSSKEIPWQKGEYAVFIDRNSYTCIRVGRGSVVHFIPMTGKALRVHRSDEKRFEDKWKPFMYPLVRAATVYAEGARVRGISEEARDHLSKILGKPLDDIKLSEEDVSTKNTDKAAIVSTTTVKEGKKVKVEPGLAKAEKATEIPKFLSREDAAKKIKAGGKLKVGRDNDTRKGSLKWAGIEAIRACKDVAAALKATFKHKGIKQEVKFTDLRSAVRRGYVVIVGK